MPVPEDAVAVVEIGDVVDHLNEGLQLIGPDFRYLYVNVVAAQHGQRAREDLVGRTMMEAYPGIERTEVFGHLTRVLAEGGVHAMENEFTFPDGTVGWFELRIARVPRGAIILSADITARKKLEAQVRRIQRMDAIGQLAGGVAHDFNNLLTIIQIYGTFLHDSMPEEDPRKADAASVLEAARRGAELTQKLLAVARHRPVTPRGVAVVPALHSIGELLRRTLGEHVKLTVTCPPDLGDVLMDPSALDQVLVNLVVNARDAMQAGGTITLEADRIEVTEAWAIGRGASLAPGTYAVLSVTDTGSGIAPGHLERIFEPFYTTKGAHGTGLGLATCWGLVEQAGGTISVYSEPGAGTTFRVYLPLTRTAAPTPEPVEAPAASVARRERILVVEDEPGVRAIIGRILGRRGYTVIEAAEASEAMRVSDEEGAQLDLLITDVVMPGTSGFDLIEAMRGRFPRLRYLVISGFTPRALDQRGLGGPDLPLLVKPFTPDLLLTAVRSALDPSR